MSSSSSYQPCWEIDTAVLGRRVHHYLKYNQIRWGLFSRLVLGVGQARLSSLLGNPKPWASLSPRVKCLYSRMEEWMETRATYGNNPYYIPAKSKEKTRGRGRPSKKKPVPKKLRSLFQWDEKAKVQEERAAVDYLVGLEGREPEPNTFTTSHISAEFLKEINPGSRREGFGMREHSGMANNNKHQIDDPYCYTLSSESSDSDEDLQATSMRGIVITLSPERPQPHPVEEEAEAANHRRQRSVFDDNISANDYTFDLDDLDIVDIDAIFQDRDGAPPHNTGSDYPAVSSCSGVEERFVDLAQLEDCATATYLDLSAQQPTTFLEEMMAGCYDTATQFQEEESAVQTVAGKDPAAMCRYTAALYQDPAAMCPDTAALDAHFTEADKVIVEELSDELYKQFLLS